MFDYAAAHGVPRADVAALWTFTITQRTELAMDKASQRVPLPLDVLKDPEEKNDLGQAGCGDLMEAANKLYGEPPSGK